MNRHTSENALAESCNNVFVVLKLCADKSAKRAAVLLGDNHVVGYVDKTTGKITGVGGLQCRIRKTLAGTVGRDEVLQH